MNNSTKLPPPKPRINGQPSNRAERRRAVALHKRSKGSKPDTKHTNWTDRVCKSMIQSPRVTEFLKEKK